MKVVAFFEYGRLLFVGTRPYNLRICFRRRRQGDRPATGLARMNIRTELDKAIGIPDGIFLNDVELDPSAIRAVMINEVVPSDPKQDFYGGPDADYPMAAVSLLRSAGAPVSSIYDVLHMGVYVTNAVKTPKSKSAVDRTEIERSLPYLEKELSLFPNLMVVMLMGDVAKKAFNTISRKATKKNAVPSVSTYKLRNDVIYHGCIRIIPSYIMTGGNILIERSKVTMATEDVAKMLDLIG